jgi:hypothetical protein
VIDGDKEESKGIWNISIILPPEATKEVSTKKVF